MKIIPPVDREWMKVTSPYGWRKGFLRKHTGIDLRSWSETWERCDSLLCESAKCVKIVSEKKWGYTVFFQLDRDKNIYLQYTHVRPLEEIEPGRSYPAGTVIGQSMQTEYMQRKGYGEHLHFAYHDGWKNRVDPAPYLKAGGVELRY